MTVLQIAWTAFDNRGGGQTHSHAYVFKGRLSTFPAGKFWGLSRRGQNSRQRIAKVFGVERLAAIIPKASVVLCNADMLEFKGSYDSPPESLRLPEFLNSKTRLIRSRKQKMD